MTKTVEVWGVVGPEGFPLSDGDNKGQTWADLCQKLGQSQAYLERVGYRCERRLLVRTGETFEDGVEACINSIASQELAWRTYEHNDKSHIAQFLLNRIRSLSPVPEPKDEATELLRQDLKRAIDTYLKGKA